MLVHTFDTFKCIADFYQFVSQGTYCSMKKLPFIHNLRENVVKVGLEGFFFIIVINGSSSGENAGTSIHSGSNESW